MSGWGCPNEVAGKCMRLKGRDCDPGIPGCVLHGRFVFSNPEKNRKPRQEKPQPGSTGDARPPDASPGTPEQAR